MNHVASIIQRFGGTRPMAKKLCDAGYAIHWNTIQNWKRTDRLPYHWVGPIMGVAKKHKIVVDKSELVSAVLGAAA